MCVCVKLNQGLRNTKNYGCEYHLCAYVYPQGPWAQATQERVHRRVLKYHHRYHPPARHGPEPTLVAELGSTRPLIPLYCLRTAAAGRLSLRLQPERTPSSSVSYRSILYTSSYRLLPERQDIVSVFYRSALLTARTYICNVVPSARTSRNVFSGL